MKIGPVEYLAGAFGVGLVIAAVRNKNPLDIVREALTGGDTSKARPIYTERAETFLSSTGGLIGSVIDAPTTIGGGNAVPGLANPTGTPPLAPIGQGGHKLHTAAVPAFRAAEAIYGSTIYVTDSYRPYAQQAAGHRADPDRFADPDKGAHVDGLAIDVDFGRTTGGQSRKGQPRYDKLAAALRAAGWISYSGGDPDKGDTWHFSYGSVR